MKKYVFFLMMFVCIQVNASEKTLEHENYVLLSVLLDSDWMKEERAVDSESLESFKELESIYLNIVDPLRLNNTNNKDDLKLALFFAYYSDVKNNAAFQEYLAEDLMPIYENNTESFLTVLSELPFLVPSNCERLGAFFGHEGKHLDERDSFIEKNTDVINRYLPPDLSKACLERL
jgi:hypothetical protein